MSKKTKELFTAESINNGIIFHSQRMKGYASIATICDGKIITQWTKAENYKKTQTKYEKIVNLKDSLIYLLTTTLLCCILLVKLVDKQFELSNIWNIRIFLISFILILLLRIIITNRKEESSHRFHAAEHMVVNAYKDLKRIPESVEELSNYSRFNKNCGTSIITLTIISLLTLLIDSFMPDTLYGSIIPCGIQIFFCILLNMNHLNILQCLLTRPATNVELSVAIEGMNTLIENENRES